MHSSIFTTSLLAGTSFLLQTAQSAYILADDYSGEAFFQSFDFFTDKDPTNGHVKYETLEKANETSLAGFMDGGNATKATYMGVDTNAEAPEGRGSVRVSSAKSYQHALVVADIVHMPSVCGMSENPQCPRTKNANASLGTWPAFWMVGDDWPNNGKQSQPGTITTPLTTRQEKST